MFSATRILDFSSGWGDRLFGALSSQDKLSVYYGIDPNSLLFPGYEKKIITRFAKNPSKFKMINAAFESLTLPFDAKNFDLIFTSPPYFDYEIYGTGINQSSPRFEDWIVKFLFRSLSKAWKLLQIDGIMAINIQEIKGRIKLYTLKRWYYGQYHTSKTARTMVLYHSLEQLC
uniref:site-specific DNA-methyltransferase (cytosine-N(4)-specific) n=1 Tax=Pithovirus LCDPAC01 TaxID=2506600 RepID=A0A481YMT9_9VIRU|nr:MAG: hypothetical protein LCDPAC01_01190 [Pithovirus LCDPAC01]